MNSLKAHTGRDNDFEKILLHFLIHVVFQNIAFSLYKMYHTRLKTLNQLNFHDREDRCDKQRKFYF